jgi:negative regulator of flagellin synthesis FlgM
MKIGPIDTAQALAQTAGERAERRAGGPAAPGTPAEPSAKVDLSTAATLGRDGVDGSFDQAKVDRIAQAIRDGKFAVNAEAIADKLIANAHELLGKAGG